ncbi:hypothetical protein ACSAZK_17330 [Methanosarcina sp. Mfa9]
MTENTGRPYEIRSMSQSMGRSMIGNMARIIRPKFEPGNPSTGRNC